MALTLNRFALVDWVQVGSPLVAAMTNGKDNPFWTDGLETSRTEATLSTTAPDTSGMSAAEDTATAGAYPAGDYKIYVTYYRDATTTYPAMESGPGAETTVTIQAASAPSDIDLTDVPTSSDAQVTDRRIYIFGGDDFEVPYYEGSVGDNSTTTYEINDTVANIQDNVVLADASGDFPKKRANADGLPPKAEFIEFWNGRLWLAKDSTLYYSRVLPDVEDFPTHQLLRLDRSGGGVGSKITQLRTHKRFLYVFFEDAVYVVTGRGFGTYRADPILPGVGHSGGPHSVISLGGYLYFLDLNLGPVKWAGAGEESQPGIDLEAFWTRVDKNRLRRAVGQHAPSHRELHWHVTEGRYDRNNRRIVLDLPSMAWTYDHGPSVSAVGLVRNELGEKCPLEGTTLGDIFQYDIGNADGVYTGTTSGTPTTADGMSMADTAATFGAAAAVEGRSVYFIDSAGDILQDNLVASRTSATVLRLTKPIPASVATYVLGGIPVRRESPPIQLDTDGPTLWQRAEVRYVKTSTAATVYFDMKDALDTDWEEMGSFDTDGDGRAEIVLGGKRGEDVQFRIRCDTVNQDFQIIDLVLKASATGGE